MTTGELLAIEQLCNFLLSQEQEIFPGDFPLYDRNAAMLGVVYYEPDIKAYAFCPTGTKT